MIKRDRYGDIDPEATFENAKQTLNNLKQGFGMKKILMISLLVMAFIVLGLSAKNIFETVPTGSYQVKQAAWTGELTVKMDSGVWFQNFGDIFTFPKSETFFFTKDSKEGKAMDESIEVTFADGSICHISGTARIVMPSTEAEAKHLIADLGFRDYHSIEQKLILPTVRRALVLTANMMTAQESYNVKRPDFLKWAAGQIEHGIAATDEVEKEFKDPITGEMIKKKVKVIRVDSKGLPVYESNPLDGTGIRLQNFEVKEFGYSPEVVKQIGEQQKAIMEVATAKANALKAEQAAITAEKDGLAKVMTAKYEKETEKIKAVVKAEEEKAVAVTKAEQNKATAELQKDAAGFTKQEQILLGQGEATRKQLVMEADGALAAKVEAFKYGIDAVAKAWANRAVPAYYVEMGGNNSSGSASDTSSLQFMNMLNTQMAKNLGLDLSIKPKTAPVKQ
jgi:regulator of protease activity HflC (stomatin/prohibitin superfamily)